MALPLNVDDRVRLAWDDGVMGGGLNDTEVRGVVVAWMPSAVPGESDDALVLLDDALTASGPDTRSREHLEVKGRYITLSTRYQGQTWNGRETTVHVTLCADDPRAEAEPSAWVASHAVWFHED